MSRLAATHKFYALAMASALFVALSATELCWPVEAAARVRPHYGGEVRIETAESDAPDFVKLLVTIH